MPLVGRAAELDLLLDSVARVPSAGLVAVVVAGEAGIGKSHLLDEATAQLRARGWPVVAVRADRLERQVPYAALAAALRTLAVDSSFAVDLRRAALAALEMPGLDPAAAEPAAAPGAAFGRACAVVTRLLTALTAAGPVVLVVDDLHELDDDSLALLAVVVRRLAAAPVALLTALRPHLPAANPAVEELIERLAERGEVVRVDLGALSPGDLGALVTPILGAQPDDNLAGEVHRRADGNPYFAGEIARSLADSHLLTLDGEHARLAVAPATIRLNRRSAVLRRVVPLDSDALTVARTLAVLRSADLERIGLIAEVTGRSEAAVAAAFDELVRANVVAHDAERGYRFAHDIVADALYDDIGPAQCRQLHGLVAERMLAGRAGHHPGHAGHHPGQAGHHPGQAGHPGEAGSQAGRVGGDTGWLRDADLLELAWHVSESAVPGDTVAVGVLVDAARRALTSAPEAAAGFCARALALLGEAAPERGELLALRCRALARASRPAAAVPPGREALALLPPGDERSRTATAVLSSLFSLARIDEAIEVVDEQIGAGPATAAMHAHRAVLLVFANRTAEGLKEAEIASAAEPASPAEAVVVRGQLTMLTSMLFRHDQTVEQADLALESAGDSTTLRLQALAVGASTGALAGLVHDATRRLRLAERLADEPDGLDRPRGAGPDQSPGAGPVVFASELALTRVVLDWLGGRWDAALEGLRTLTAELETREQVTLTAALAAIELEIRTWRGELVLAASIAERPPPVSRNMANLHALALGGFLAARGDPDGARRTLSAAVDDPVTASYSCLLLAREAEVALAQGLADEVARVLATLVEVATPRVSPWSVTTLHRTAGTVHRDREALDLAVREAEAGGLVFERARAQLALAELVPDAVPGLVEAYLTFGRLGAHGLRRQAGRRLSALGEKVPRVRSRAAGLLTTSEEAVARLVQQGMRNREIAAALHYSPRSIEVYLSRIYAKLRVSSRLELARALDAMDGR